MGEGSRGMIRGRTMHILETAGRQRSDMVGRCNGHEWGRGEYKGDGEAHTKEMERGGEAGLWKEEGTQIEASARSKAGIKWKRFCTR